MISLHTLASPNRKSRRRRGRGHGSGLGTYAGRGIKGQRARSGGRTGMRRRGIKHLIGRLPKVRGFQRPSHHKGTVTLDLLSRVFADGEAVTLEKLQGKGLLHRRIAWLKVLRGQGEPKRLTVLAHSFSAGAMEALTRTGGTATVLAPTLSPRPRKKTNP